MKFSLQKTENSGLAVTNTENSDRNTKYDYVIKKNYNTNISVNSKVAKLGFLWLYILPLGYPLSHRVWVLLVVFSYTGSLVPDKELEFILHREFSQA